MSFNADYLSTECDVCLVPSMRRIENFVTQHGN